MIRGMPKQKIRKYPEYTCSIHGGVIHTIIKRIGGKNSKFVCLDCWRAKK